MWSYSGLTLRDCRRCPTYKRPIKPRARALVTVITEQRNAAMLALPPERVAEAQSAIGTFADNTGDAEGARTAWTAALLSPLAEHIDYAAYLPARAVERASSWHRIEDGRGGCQVPWECDRSGPERLRSDAFGEPGRFRMRDISMSTSNVGIMYVLVHRYPVGPFRPASEGFAPPGVPGALSMAAHLLSAEPRLAAALGPSGARRTCPRAISSRYCSPAGRVNANPPPSEQPQTTQAPPPVPDDPQPETWVSKTWASRWRRLYGALPWRPRRVGPGRLKLTGRWILDCGLNRLRPTCVSCKSGTRSGASDQI
jgi:hypothetical protein